MKERNTACSIPVTTTSFNDTAAIPVDAIDYMQRLRSTKILHHLFKNLKH
jgi:hypothetical protein